MDSRQSRFPHHIQVLFIGLFCPGSQSGWRSMPPQRGKYYTLISSDPARGNTRAAWWGIKCKLRVPFLDDNWPRKHCALLSRCPQAWGREVHRRSLTIPTVSLRDTRNREFLAWHPTDRPALRKTGLPQLPPFCTFFPTPPVIPFESWTIGWAGREMESLGCCRLPSCFLCFCALCSTFYLSFRSGCCDR